MDEPHEKGKRKAQERDDPLQDDETRLDAWSSGNWAQGNGSKKARLGDDVRLEAAEQQLETFSRLPSEGLAQNNVDMADPVASPSRNVADVIYSSASANPSLINNLDRPFLAAGAEYEPSTSRVKGMDVGALPEPFRHEDAQSLPARVGRWIVPDEPEVWQAPEIGIDPNGDDDMVTTHVRGILQPSQNSFIGAEADAPLPSASHPDYSALRDITSHSESSQPITSTPPLRKRERRVVKRPKSPQHIQSPARVEREGSPYEDLSRSGLSAALAEVPGILASPYSSSARTHISELVSSSPMIPSFLKTELRHFLQHPRHDDELSLGSETQDDGYLRTKASWFFELCKIDLTEQSVGGDDLVGDDSADFDSVLLSILPSGEFAVERAARSKVLSLRSNVKTNAWFDASGQPFAVTYRSPNTAMDSASSNPSLATQAGSQEVQVLREELGRANSAKDSLTQELTSVIASRDATEEQMELVRRLYDDASSLATSAEREAQDLRKENSSLKLQIAASITATQDLSDSQIKHLTESLKQVTAQRDLLIQQNELTNDEIRRKASEWDLQEARKAQEQKRRERAEAARLETHLALQATLLGNEISRRPQDYLLAVDLDAQRKNLDERVGAPAGSPRGGEDEDELAALANEAEEHGANDLLVDTSAPRSRRARSRRSASRHNHAAIEADEDEDELAALRNEAVAAGDDVHLALPSDGARSRRTRSRRSVSRAVEESPKMQDLAAPSSPSHSSRRRPRLRQPLGDEEAASVADAIAQSQTNASDNASQALEAEFAAFDASAQGADGRLHEDLY